MDESGCFFKALPDNRLVKKGKNAKVAKIKAQIHDCFFNAAGKILEESVVIWKSAIPCCLEDSEIHHEQLMYTISLIENYG